MVKTLERNDKIDRFVEEFWPGPIYEVDLKEDYADEIKKYIRFMRKKYGKEKIREHGKLSKRLFESEGAKKEYDRANSFVFKNDIHIHANPHIFYRGKETLRSLLTFLNRSKESEKPYAVVDFGSGDGMIDIGLALYLEDLEKIYAVDYNGDGLECMRRIANGLSDEKQEILERKIFRVKGDYTTDEFRDYIKGELPGGADYVLATYTKCGIDDVFPYAISVLKDGGGFLRYNQFGLEPYEIDETLRLIEEGKNMFCRQFGFNLRLFDRKVIEASMMTIAGFVGRADD
jgi:hypothetical protein